MEVRRRSSIKAGRDNRRVKNYSISFRDFFFILRLEFRQFIAFVEGLQRERNRFIITNLLYDYATMGK